MIVYLGTKNCEDNKIGFYRTASEDRFSWIPLFITIGDDNAQNPPPHLKCLYSFWMVTNRLFMLVLLAEAIIFQEMLMISVRAFPSLSFDLLSIFLSPFQRGNAAFVHFASHCSNISKRVNNIFSKNSCNLNWLT